MNTTVFADLDLARRLERAEAQSNARFVEARARLFPQSGACWIEVAGAYAMFDGPSSPLTQTFGLGLFETPTHGALERIESFFRERRAPVFHEVSPVAGLPLLTLLNERGYQPVEFSSVMYRSIEAGAGLGAALNERIRVRVAVREEWGVWTETAVRGWSESPELCGFLRDAGRICAEREDGLCFLAEQEGRPIAAGALVVCGGVALLAGACTVPEGRRQGAQLALLDARLRYAAARGCDIAMVCAQEPGGASQRNAERHGFRLAYTRIKWQGRLAG